MRTAMRNTPSASRSAKVTSVVVGMLALACFATSAPAATQGTPAKNPVTSTESPYRGNRDGLSYGAYGELRFGHDRQAGVSNPDWFSFGQVGGFVRVRAHSRVRFALEGA